MPLAKSSWRWRIHSSAQPNAQWEVHALQYDFVAAVNTHAHLATVYWLQGFIARSATSHAHALQNARQLGQPFVVASALYFSLVRKALCRDYVAMAPIARELQAPPRKSDFRPSARSANSSWAVCLSLRDARSTTASRLCGRDSRLSGTAGSNVNRVVLLATLAELSQSGRGDRRRLGNCAARF